MKANRSWFIAILFAAVLSGFSGALSMFRTTNDPLKACTLKWREAVSKLAASDCRGGELSGNCNPDRFVSIDGLLEYSFGNARNAGPDAKMDDSGELFVKDVTGQESEPTFLTMRFEPIKSIYLLLGLKIVSFVLPFTILVSFVCFILINRFVMKKGELLEGAKKERVDEEFRAFGASLERPFIVFDRSFRITFANSAALSGDRQLVGKHLIDWSRDSFELAEEIDVLAKNYVRGFGLEVVRISGTKYWLTKEASSSD